MYIELTDIKFRVNNQILKNSWKRLKSQVFNYVPTAKMNFEKVLPVEISVQNFFQKNFSVRAIWEYFQIVYTTHTAFCAFF